MIKFLIDVNLPYRFSLWHSPEYIHQNDINDVWKDNEIWNYAKEKNLTIITKDADFSARIIFTDPPPRIIHLRIGYMKMKEFHQFLNHIWSDILKISEECKLVTVFVDRIEGVN